MAAFDSAEFWNPKVRGAECLNRQAARSILPIADLRTRMVMAGHSKAEIVSALKAAFDNKQLPDLESGNMVFMMSKSAYLYDAGDHNGPHLMFFTALKDGMDWGLAHRARQLFPVLTGSYRRRNRPRRKGCRRFLCSQSKLQSGPMERPHPCIKSRLTTTQSRHPLSSGLATRVVCSANCRPSGSSCDGDVRAAGGCLTFVPL